MEHRLDSVEVSIRPGYAVSVVLASQGYPGNYSKGKSMRINKMPASEYSCPVQVTYLRLPPDVVAFHAGTRKSGDSIVTAGGRVVAVTAYAPSLQEALDAVYIGVSNVDFEGKVFRRDIAHR